MHRLILFDIDCTLIDAHGAGSRAIFRAIKDVYRLQGELRGYSFHGRTDPGIIRDLTAMWSADPEVATSEFDGGTQPEVVTAVAARLGYSAEEIDRLLPVCLERYVQLIQEEVAAAYVEVLPGVDQLVRALSADDRVLLGLLTGNVEQGARAKLAPTGLLPYFVLGAFGSDSPLRPDLPAVAVARAAALDGRSYTGKQVVVVGDTPADIECGAHLGVRTVAVATGRFSVDELSAHGPDHVFPDLSDWHAAFQVMVE
jgi:phosphoglycolate phosphatase-like HAD superfamily hydrolase